MRSIPPELAQSALDAAPDAMLIIGAAGVILFANRPVSALFGYAREHLVGHSMDTLLPDGAPRSCREGSYVGIAKAIGGTLKARARLR